MNRIVTNLNFLGVVALAILCMIQWQANSQIFGQLGRTNQVRLDQAAKIAEQDATLNQNSTDLADVRQRLSLAESDLKDINAKLAAANQQIDQLSAQRDQLKTSLDQWVAACAARDQEIKQAEQQIQKLTTDRDQAIAKFNDLADKYNGVVKQLNGGR
jgi:chromosome segregation ATPase